jgi:hypothetical protein
MCHHTQLHHCFSETGPYYIGQAGPELEILLSLLPELDMISIRNNSDKISILYKT